MKRKYPLILIDKTRTEGHPYHHIAVMGENPFVVRVRLLENWLDYQPKGVFYMHSLTKTRALVFEVVSSQEATPGVKSLLRKAAKKYLLGFRDDNYKGKDLNLDNQIYQQKLTIEHNKRNYARLVEQAGGNEELAKFNIALAQATLESLYQLKELRYGK